MRHKPQAPRRDSIYYIGGEKFASVTDVCSVIAKPYLLTWAAKTAAAAALADPDKYDTAEKAAAVVESTKGAAAIRGRTVHDIVETWARGLPREPVDPTLQGYVTAFDAFVNSWSPRPLHAECVVLNKTHKYAGRLDLIAQLGSETWLIDFKTSRAVWSEYGLQLSAYRNAEFFVLPDDSLAPMPSVDKTGVVLLRETGTFGFTQVDEPFEVFVAAMRVHEWKKAHD